MVSPQYPALPPEFVNRARNRYWETLPAGWRGSVLRQAPGFDGMVRLRLHPCPQAFWWLLLAHGAGVLGLSFLSCPRWCAQGLLLAMTYGLIQGLRTQVWRCAQCSVLRVDVGGAGMLCVHQRSGQRETGRILPGTLVTDSVVLLRWRAEHARRTRYCWLLRAACDAREHWLLRVLLRHPL